MKRKVGKLEKNLFLTFFLIVNLFRLLPQVSQSCMSLLGSKVTLILQEKIEKFELSHQK